MESATSQNAGINLCERVRTSCSRVMSKAQHVKINEAKLLAYAEAIVEKNWSPSRWDENDFHYSQEKEEGNVEDKLGYIFALDTINFCFWPDGSWEYADLAKALGNLVEKHYFKPENLVKLTLEDMKKDVFNGKDFPLLEERHRLFRDLGLQTLKHFGGQYKNIVLAAENSVVKLIEILTATFPGLQDHSIYNGEQIHLLKRAQILVSDIWGAFKGKGIGYFKDMDQLTMFPDYRVPQLLRHEGIMEYSKELFDVVDNRKEIDHGHKFEVEIRAATVVAVEMLKKLLAERKKILQSFEIDWLLWQKGEAIKDEIKPHHRTLSIFY